MLVTSSLPVGAHSNPRIELGQFLCVSFEPSLLYPVCVFEKNACDIAEGIFS